MVSNGGSNRNVKEKNRSIASAIEEVNNQEDIDLLIARLQAKKYQGKMMSKSMAGCVAAEGATLLPPEEPLDWDNIEGDNYFDRMVS